jgi:rfaE bifunctional protein kinase chain/domain
LSADLSRLENLVESFPRQSIVVLGDFVVDRFVTGEISRVSREAPVLILRHRETEIVPGGGANAVNNLVSLGARVYPVGAVGDDESGRSLLAYFRRKRVNVSNVVRVPGRTTPTKTRYLAGWTHKAGQQVLRVDHEPGEALAASLQRRLARKAAQLVRKGSALLVSDYGFGTAAPGSVRSARRAAGARKFVVTLDSRYALADYRNAGVTAATPNESELEALYHTRIANDAAKLERFGKSALRMMGLEALVVTRGKDGMVVFQRGEPSQSIPIYGSDEVADVTGAGDTVIAAFTLALAAGASFYEAAVLANYAGGIVVMKRGTATVTASELLAALRKEATGGIVQGRSDAR